MVAQATDHRGLFKDLSLDLQPHGIGHKDLKADNGTDRFGFTEVLALQCGEGGPGIDADIFGTEEFVALGEVVDAQQQGCGGFAPVL